MYKKFGFKNHEIGDSVWGGEAWHKMDIVLDWWISHDWTNILDEINTDIQPGMSGKCRFFFVLLRAFQVLCIIIVNMGFIDVVMFNPVIVSKRDMYETEEGCLSLNGVRKTTRYQEIEVEYYDFNWKKQRQKLSGWTAQICQHEIDHLSGKII